MQALVQRFARPLTRQLATSASRGAAGQRLLEDQLFERLAEKSVISWADFQRKDFPDVLESLKKLSQINPDATPLRVSFGERHFATLVISSLGNNEREDLLTDFIDHHGLDKLSTLQVGLYMKFCSDPVRILEAWRHLCQKKGQLYDAATTVNIAEGLFKTDRWREAVNLIERLFQLDGLASAAVAVVIRKLVEEDLQDEAFSWFQRFHSEERHVINDDFRSLMLTRENAERLFGMAAEFRLRFHRDLFKDLQADWMSVRIVNIGQSSICPNCRSRLRRAKPLTSEELQELRQAIRSRILNKNIYMTTTPEELQHFETFLQKRGPFDAVLDGLNIGFRISQDIVAKEASRLVEVEKKRVLIMGRKHMLKWPGMKELPKNAAFYVTENISRDDPFILLAALSSSRDCVIISSDKYRDHRADLALAKQRATSEEEVTVGVIQSRLFTRWLSTCQRRLGQRQTSHDVAPQKHGKGWHLPLQHQKHGEPEDPQTDEHWACVTVTKD